MSRPLGYLIVDRKGLHGLEQVSLDAYHAIMHFESMHYFDAKRHWTSKIEPHLTDPGLNAILIRDFDKFTRGLWGKRFTAGQYPREFESCDWSLDHRGPVPRYWKYVKHSAYHWLVNFNLRLAQLVEPNRPWRILTSDDHSTVWDGDRTLFDLNFLALGVPPEECFRLADGKRLSPGKELRVYLASRHPNAA